MSRSVRSATSPVVGRGPEYFGNRYDPQRGNYLRLNRSASVRHHHETAAKLLRAEIGDTMPRQVLDLGCAVGDFTARLMDEFPEARVVGMDFVKEGLEEARRRYPGIEVIEAALPDIPFDSQDIDVVCCMEVLYYLDDRALERVVAEIDRVLVPDGLILATTNLDDGRRYFTEPDFIDVFRPAFEPVAVVHEHCKLYRTVSLSCQVGRRWLLRSSGSGVFHRGLIRMLDGIEESDAVAKFWIGLGRAILGSRGITNGAFVFRRRGEAGIDHA